MKYFNIKAGIGFYKNIGNEYGFAISINNHKELLIGKKSDYDYHEKFFSREVLGSLHKRTFINLPLIKIEYHEMLDPTDVLSIPDPNYMVDEFDACFNALAIATLQYHLNHSVLTPSKDKIEKYNDLIERLSIEPDYSQGFSIEQKIAYENNQYRTRIDFLDIIHELTS